MIDECWYTFADLLSTGQLIHCRHFGQLVGQQISADFAAKMPERSGFGWPKKSRKHPDVEGSGDLKQNNWQSNEGMSHGKFDHGSCRSEGFSDRIKTTAVFPVRHCGKGRDSFRENHENHAGFLRTCSNLQGKDRFLWVQLMIGDPHFLPALRSYLLSWSSAWQVVLDPAASKWPQCFPPFESTLVIKPAPLPFDRETGHFWTASKYGVQH